MATIAANFTLVLREINRHPYLSAKIHSRGAKLQPGEIAMQLSLEVPAELFRRPTLRASVRIPPNTSAPVVTAEVKDGIAAALQERLGLHVHVTADDGSEGDPSC